MASGNPTLDAAEAETGMEPLNTGPKEAQAPQVRPVRDMTIPSSLAVLPQDCSAYIFPLSLSPKLDNNQSVSTLPSASDFEELVKAVVRPEGPSRAEDVASEDFARTAAGENADVLKKVHEAADGGDVKVYKIVVGVKKVEYYVAGLDADRERIVAVRVVGLEA